MKKSFTSSNTNLIIQLMMLILLLISVSSYGQKSPNDFVFTVKTDHHGISSNNEFLIGLLPNTTYLFDVDKDNDGIFEFTNISSSNYPGRSAYVLQYSVPGTYTIRIRGRYHKINFHDSKKVIALEQWGNQKWESMAGAFSGCDNLVGFPVDTPDLSRVTSMVSMFSNTNLINWPLNHWDVSHVTNMTGMFYGAKNFNQPLNNWDVSNVTDMNLMFCRANKFNQPLNNWDVSKVTDMTSMFESATAFNQPLNAWNTSNVTSTERMFWLAIAFNQPLNIWDVSEVSSMRLMFSEAVNFNQPLNTWNTSNVTSTERMFQEAYSFNQPLDNWDVSSVTNMFAMFELDTVFNQPLNTWNMSNVTSTERMFQEARSFNQPLGDWDVSSVTDMYAMFRNAESFNQSLGKWDITGISEFSAFWNLLDGTSLSIKNYDNTLTHWQSKPHPDSVLFVGVSGLVFCAADSVRALLIDDGWTFTGDSLNCLVAVEEVNLESSMFRLYPNPTTGIVSVNVLNNSDAALLSVYNGKGQLVKETQLVQQNNHLDLSDLKSGLYFIHYNGKVEKLMLQQ